jgi:hypothetical protein
MNAGRLAAVDGRRCWVKAGQRVQHRHHVLGLAAPAHPDGQTEAAVFIDHVEELERPPISAGFGLKVRTEPSAGRARLWFTSQPSRRSRR